ncbi:MAG: DMT family transporter [Acidimicrobiales bacterium]
MAPTRRRGALAVLAAGVVFSFGGLFFRAADDIDAWQYLTFRGLGAVLVVAPIVWWQNRQDLGGVVRRLAWQHAAAGVLLGTMMISFIVALSHADVAFVLLFQALAPLGAAVFSWLILREVFERDAIIASGAAIVGVAVMVSSGLDAGIGWAIVIVGFIPLGLGMYSTLIRAGGEGDPVVPVLIAGGVCGTGAALVAAFGNGFDVSGRDLVIGLLAGALLIGMPLPFFNWGQQAVPAPDGSLLLMSEIVLGPVWVWWAYDETPTDATLVGGAIILAAVVWLTQRARDTDAPLRTSRG